jgi:hypothetical protein
VKKFTSARSAKKYFHAGRDSAPETLEIARWQLQNRPGLKPFNAQHNRTIPRFYWLFDFCDRAPDRNLFGFHVLWNGARRFRIDDGFSVMRRMFKRN